MGEAKRRKLKDPNYGPPSVHIISPGDMRRYEGFLSLKPSNVDDDEYIGFAEKNNLRIFFAAKPVIRKGRQNRDEINCWLRVFLIKGSVAPPWFNAKKVQRLCSEKIHQDFMNANMVIIHKDNNEKPAR